MARKPSPYNLFVSQRMRAARPRSLPEARRVMQAAAAEWAERGGAIVPVRANPGGGLLKLLVYGGIAYLALRAMGKLPAPAQQA